MKPQLQVPQQVIDSDVERALAEDIGGGDISAELIAADSTASARVITREAGVLCGQAWATAVFAAVDDRCQLDWLARDGDVLVPEQTLFTVTGPARALLTAERTALNFLQTLSGIGTR
ncbi:MAG: nicotinate-nucleotide diphosphorylase (carboxylating), partial [Chromatocurvus sp.]